MLIEVAFAGDGTFKLLPVPLRAGIRLLGQGP